MSILDKLAEKNGIMIPPKPSTNAEIEAAMCELEELISEKIADIENALCEMDGGI